MSLNETSTNQRPVVLKPQQAVGGAVIDEKGREVPITEGMIQRACRELDKNYTPSKHA